MTIDLSMLAAIGVLLSGLVAGFVGGMVGLGGGVIAVPALTILFGIDIRVAVAASLAGIVAVSISTALPEQDRVNYRLGTIMVVPMMLGAIVGGVIGTIIPANVVSVVFAAVLLFTAALLIKARDKEAVPGLTSDDGSVSGAGSLSATFHDVALGTDVTYVPSRVAAGAAIAASAGIISGLTGVGGGVIVIPVMTLLMGVPHKAAGATSHYMVGMTAIAGFTVYLAQGFVKPYVVGAVALGMLVGAQGGTRIGKQLPTHVLVLVFAVVLVGIAVDLVLKVLDVVP